jgi:hypothetical protein
MKAVYAVRCDFAGPAVAAADAAWSAALQWIGAPSELGSSGPDEDGGVLDLADGSRAHWRLVAINGAEVKHLEHVLPAGSASGWRTLVWTCLEGDHAWAIVRSGPENPAGVVTVRFYDAHRPRIVGDWINELTVVGDGRRLSDQALNYGLNDAERLIELLLEPRRRLPVIGISKSTDEQGVRVLADPYQLARDLAGNAHVIVLDPAVSWRLTETIGRPLSTYGGAVRIWWPQMSLDDDPYRHTLIMPDRILASPRRAHRHVTHRVWRAAVDAIGIPPLETRLLARRNRQRVEERMADLSRRATAGDDIVEDFLEQLDENQRLEDQLNEVLIENEELREALTAAETAVDETTDDDALEVETVEDAVRLAATETENVVYLQSAFESARESQYASPSQALRDLRAINRVAARWRAGDLPGGFEAAFAEEPVRYQPGVSQTARTTYRSDYEIGYGGNRVLMGPHLRRGVGAPSAILRIYWYVDEASRQLVVGHVGRKLRDAHHS